MSSHRGCFHLFVYGTLRRRFRNPHALLLAQSSELLGLGRVRGRLYRFKRYPGMHLDAGASTWISGEICRFRDLRLLAALDRYEGPNYERVLAEILRANGSYVICWIYQLRESQSVP